MSSNKETVLIQAISASSSPVTVNSIREGKITELTLKYTIDAEVLAASTLDQIFLVSDILGDYVASPNAAVQLRQSLDTSSADYKDERSVSEIDESDSILKDIVSDSDAGSQARSTKNEIQQNNINQAHQAIAEGAESSAIDGDTGGNENESKDSQSSDTSSNTLFDDISSGSQEEFPTIYEDSNLSDDVESSVFDDGFGINSSDDLFGESFQEEEIGYLLGELDFDDWEFSNSYFEDMIGDDFLNDEDEFYNEASNDEYINDEIFLDDLISLEDEDIDSPPTIAYEGGSPYQYEVSSGDPLPMVSATDAQDGTLTVDVNYSQGFDLAVLGEYTITYTVEDSDYNIATQQQVIHVVDTTAPIFTSLSSALNPDYTLVLDDVPEDLFLTDGVSYEQMFELMDREDTLSVRMMSEHDPSTSYGSNFLYVYGVSDELGNGTFVSSSVVTAGEHLPSQIQEDFVSALSSADEFALDFLSPLESYTYNSNTASIVVDQSNGFFSNVDIMMDSGGQADLVGSYDAYFMVYSPSDVQQTYDNQLF